MLQINGKTSRGRGFEGATLPRWRFSSASSAETAQSLSKPQLPFAETDKLIPKLKWKFKGPRIAKTILKKK